MKVIAINGSPRANGNTYQAIEACTKKLNEQGIETEILQIGTKGIRGCLACRKCKTGQITGCVITNDITNEYIEKMKQADGIIVGSPVYYAGISGDLKCFLDRVFYSSASSMRFKPCAAIAIARRAGTTTTYDQINHYFALGEMICVPTVYWSGAFGSDIGEVNQDVEGVGHVETIGNNMAWLMKTLEAGKEKNPPIPPRKERIFTNFIR